MLPFPRFVLASASPARRRLLQTIGIEPAICVSHFDEDSIQVFDPGQLVQVLAQAKARTVADRLCQEPALRAELLAGDQRALVLGCDSVLLVGGEVWGKPADPAEAIDRWRAMRGTVGDLYTGHALVELGQTSQATGQATAPGTWQRQRDLLRSATTRVHFAQPSDAQIAAYVATGEPLACAGCFAIEGKGGLFVEAIEGCHTNVIGLSLPLIRQMVDELGYDITTAWTNQA